MRFHPETWSWLKPVLPLVLTLVCLAAPSVLGDAGVLIPSNRKQPDPEVLSIAEMDVEVIVDNGDARVAIK